MVKDAEWNDAYAVVMPMLGVVIGVFGLAISILALQRQEEVVGSLTPYGVDVDIPRVRYSGENIYLEVRESGEWHDIREFVQPDEPYLRQAIRHAIW